MTEIISIVSGVIMAALGYIFGYRMQRVKIEEQSIKNLEKIITIQSKSITDLETRFNEKCEWMQRELDEVKKKVEQNLVLNTQNKGSNSYKNKRNGR